MLDKDKETRKEIKERSREEKMKNKPLTETEAIALYKAIAKDKKERHKLIELLNKNVILPKGATCGECRFWNKTKSDGIFGSPNSDNEAGYCFNSSINTKIKSGFCWSYHPACIKWEAKTSNSEIPNNEKILNNKD